MSNADYKSEFHEQYKLTLKKYIRQAIDSLYSAISSGKTQTYINVDWGDWSTSESLMYNICDELNSLGYYTKYGVHEVTSGGLKKHFVLVSFYAFQEKKSWWKKTILYNIIKKRL